MDRCGLLSDVMYAILHWFNQVVFVVAFIGIISRFFKSGKHSRNWQRNVKFQALIRVTARVYFVLPIGVVATYICTFINTLEMSNLVLTRKKPTECCRTLISRTCEPGEHSSQQPLRLRAKNVAISALTSDIMR